MYKILGTEDYAQVPRWNNEVEPFSFSDSDWAGDKDNRRSINGFIIFLCGVPIVWQSKQQKTIALSSSEAEFVAISEAVKEILFLLQLLKTMNIPVETPVTLRVDNMGAIFMSENASSGVRTRHVDMRYHFVREQVADKIVEIFFVNTDKNTADGLTKNRKSEMFEKHRKDFVWDKEECGNTALAYQIMEDEQDTVLKEKHWTSVGRVLEVSLDSSTDVRAFTSTDVNTQINRVIYPKIKDLPMDLGKYCKCSEIQNPCQKIGYGLGYGFSSRF